MLLLLACTPVTTLDAGPADSGIVDDSTDTDDGGPLGDPALVCQAEVSCGSAIFDEPKVPCSLRIESGDGVVMHDGAAMIELRGRSSVEFPKPQYSVELHESAELVVWFGQTWSYLDTGETPAANWTSVDFDDSSWRSGAAPLGYGDSPETEVGYGPDEADKHRTTWFRHTFSTDPAGIAELELGLVRDDSAIVYLNGTAVVASNIAADAGADDFATSAVQEEFESQWYSYFVDPALLNAGENVLAVEVHQSDATSSDLRFDLYLEASTGRPTPNFFGFGGEDDWILNGAYIDRLLWRNKLAYDLFQSFGGTERWGAEQAFCELTLDGEYQGIYLLGEKPDPDDDRIDIADDDGTGRSFIIKLDDAGGFRDSNVSEGEWRAVYPTDEAAWTGVGERLDAWEAGVLAGDERQWEVFDVDSAVDWIILEELTKNNDAYFLSVHLWQDVGGRIFLAPWDFDLTLGYPYYDCGWESWVPRQPYVDVWADSPAFQARLATRWAELRTGPLADDAILARIAGYETTMGAALERNFERWPVEDIAFSWGGTDNWLCPSASWEEEHERVLAWIPERTAWIDENVAGY